MRIALVDSDLQILQEGRADEIIVLSFEALKKSVLRSYQVASIVLSVQVNGRRTQSIATYLIIEGIIANCNCCSSLDIKDAAARKARVLSIQL